MVNDGNRQSKTPDAALAYGVTVLCCQFKGDAHTSDILGVLPLLLERSSGDPAFAGIRDAALSLLAAHRQEQEGVTGAFLGARIDGRKAVEDFAWRRFCDLYDVARSVTPRHARRDSLGKPASGEIG